MQLFIWAYKAWQSPDRVREVCVKWIHEKLNNHPEDPRPSPTKKVMSIKVVLGWLTFRILIVVLILVFCSCAIGLWLKSRNCNGLGTVQTAWGIASYVATAGARRYHGQIDETEYHAFERKAILQPTVLFCDLILPFELPYSISSKGTVRILSSGFLFPISQAII
jgi:hypothetical protein